MVVIVDVEATCWKTGRRREESEIIEIGAVKDSGEEFQSFIKPVRFPILSDFCKQLTSIKQEDVDTADKFGIVIRKFIDFVGDDLVVSWGYYDRKMFERQCREWVIPWQFQHMSIKHKYAEIKKVKPCGLARALEVEGLILEGTHHRGIDDARNIFKVYNKVKDQLKEE